jgi:hypothetical protein
MSEISMYCEKRMAVDGFHINFMDEVCTVEWVPEAISTCG